ncbi:hypothetical protein SERLA73DRAFT_154758 [Serpula lacrymans var. lacrymans S7.3]|uniref:Uncharacterized protein n=1 Tax=Serpula lacrymans var. lacrymans (strain S7.3) TaxID=936435 RepID=F8Q5H4_SERL3|nr:hypothetical protein SERLA73DRAFT_154758 [Serpula lacrymans var. lacrymans S7.3]
MSMRFPPFPPVPDGVTITPFEAFVPSGYKQSAPDSGVEVDSCDIPTVKIDTEEEVIKKRKDKKRRRNAGQGTDASGRLVPWWEEWEEGEESRTTSYPFKSSMSLVDRVHQAADDFRIGRTWPPLAGGVRAIWDHFRLHVGLLATLPIYRKPKSGSKGLGGGELSDEEEETGPQAKHLNPAIIQDILEEIPHPGKELEPQDETSDLRLGLLRQFIDDMETSTKIFLSFYLREKGLIWTDRNLSIAPTLLHFFLRFMLRNGTFSESKEHEDNLKRAINITKLAEKELPLTSKIAKLLPDKISEACVGCWGKMGGLTFQASAAESLPEDEDGITDESTEKIALDQEDEGIIPSDALFVEGVARQIADDNIGSDVHIETATLDDIVMGENSSDLLDNTNTVHDTAGFDAEQESASHDWTVMIDEELAASAWTKPSATSLLAFLGPTTFPLTHTTGIVEFSTRRIVEILPPMSTHPLSIDSPQEGVEGELKRQLARIVMEPWIKAAQEEDLDPDIGKPMIMPTSRGSVVQSSSEKEGEDVHADVDAVSVRSNEGVFDPHRDVLTVLVDPSTVQHLSAGMGLAATWVEIARCEDAREIESRGGNKAAHASDGLWYMEDVVGIFSSFHTKGE